MTEFSQIRDILKKGYFIQNRVNFAKSKWQNEKLTIFFGKKNALFLLIIWWFREKVVPLHAFSRRVDMRVCIRDARML